MCWDARGGFPQDALLPSRGWGLLLQLLLGCVLFAGAPGNLAALFPGRLILPGKGLFRWYSFAGLGLQGAEVAGLRS
jgi:hypothetical protein